ARSLVGGTDAYPGRGPVALADDLGNDAVHDINRDREADTGARAGGRDDGGGYPDHSSCRIEERPSGISRVDGGIGLDDVRDFPPTAGRKPSLERADDARGQRLIEPERVAYGEHRLSDLQVIRGADGNGWRQRLRRFDQQHR